MLREEYYSVWCEDKSYLEEEAQTKRVAAFSYFQDALDYAHQLTQQGVVPCTVRSVPVGGHCNHWHYTQPQGATPCDSTL